MFKEFVKENTENIINTIGKLVKYNSVSNETGNPDMPFGKECKEVLDKTLEIAESMGFRTKNIDGYCGYIEFGEGNEMVGIIGHLDIVPADIKDGWTTSPFEATVRNGKLYGRGTIDDKGPVVASLYAMKAVAETCKINKRVRLIVGLNEEKDSKCMARYKETEEIPTISFSPDANFPAIYAEKGILSLSLTNTFGLDNFEIIDIDCQNNALNVVPKYASITLKYTGSSEMPSFETAQNVEIQNIDCSTVKIISTGIAAHAAHPSLGKNAIYNLVQYLLKYFKNEYLETLIHLGIFEIESPEFLSRKEIAYATEFEDNSVIQDESGILTSNVASLEYENGKLTIKINLRVPVKTKLDDIILQYKKLANIFENIEVKTLSASDALYVEKDSFLVKTLVDIFNRKTDTQNTAIAIGGGTYARCFPNCIAYGPTMPNDPDMCHQVDEYIELEKLFLATEIYAEAIYELAK